ncbi:MAG: superoxide dismutase, Ni [Desulfobacterales bacterium]|nr:superoxide dismutase, Ni [Desulfobacterales bacterium]
MKRVSLLFLIGIFIIGFYSFNAVAHCEIPCGIYNDQMRIEMIKEHIITIHKSMDKILELEKGEPQNFNQLIRWINNKEDHAGKIQDIVTQYFMTQRIKPDTKRYEKKLGLLHQMLIYSMKCKQTTDVVNVEKLNESVKAFQKLYFEAK